jgi:tetratricopeptide (TPR) repeat protein
MTLDDRLRAAAAAPNYGHGVDLQQIQRDHEMLEADYQRRLRSHAALHRLDDEIAGLELEEASYQLAKQYEREGRLQEAARWFLKAAQVDYADAAVRLADTLDRLGDQRGAAYWRAAADDLLTAGDTDPDTADSQMDCTSVQARADQYLRRSLPAADLAAIRDHLPRCQACLENYATRPTDSGGPDPDHYGPATRLVRRAGANNEEPHAYQRAVTAGGTAVLEVDKGTLPTETASNRASVRRTNKGRRIVGVERQTLIKDLVKRYTSGESIRALAAATGRSYGFVRRALTESGVQLRQQGGARQRKES